MPEQSIEHVDEDVSLLHLLVLLPDFPHAVCKGSADASFWDFSVPRETVSQARIRRYNASVVCKKKCAHAQECRDWAAENNETGVWGGEIFPTPHAAFLKCSVCRRPMLKRKSKRRMPRGHVRAFSPVLCVHCHRVGGKNVQTE